MLNVVLGVFVGEPHAPNRAADVEEDKRGNQPGACDHRRNRRTTIAGENTNQPVMGRLAQKFTVVRRDDASCPSYDSSCSWYAASVPLFARLGGQEAGHGHNMSVVADWAACKMHARKTTDPR